MILIISHQADAETYAVMQALAALRAEVTLLDLAAFPQAMQMSLDYGAAGGRSYLLRREGAPALDLATCRVAWWRRPQAFELHPELTRPEYRSFAYNESSEAFTGLWQALDAFWVNPPLRDEAAHRKVYQLRVAQDVGLTIPRTLISNDTEQIRAFIAEQGTEHTVYKSFSATERHWRETRTLKPEELSLLESARYAPVIFQAYVPAQVDLRITVVGEALFPAAIHSQSTSYRTDYRMDFAHALVEPVRLPNEIEQKLLALMARLGLVYGAIDMRLTPDGRYVFLEINPAGQFRFIEQRTSQPITASLARLLALHDAGACAED